MIVIVMSNSKENIYRVPYYKYYELTDNIIEIRTIHWKDAMKADLIQLQTLCGTTHKYINPKKIDYIIESGFNFVKFEYK